MPYSLETKMRKHIKKQLDKRWKNRERDIKKAADDADILTMYDLEREAHNMYQKLITDYYTYKTMQYIRHEQDHPGTRTGVNLYRADNIRLKKKGKSYELFLETNYKQMAAGYRDHSRDDVLEMIKSGWRYMGRYRSPEPWYGDYNGEYFDVYDVDINEAFNEFRAQFKNTYNAFFIKNIQNLKGNYEYW